MSGTGTKDDPWQLTTPPGTSGYSIYRDDSKEPPILVCQVGKTTLTYQARAIDDLRAMLAEAGGWVPSAGPTSRSPRRLVRSKPGVDRRTTRLAAGTA